MLEKEKKILQDEYERSLNIVKGSKTHRCFVDEKIAHSLQVFEAGNYLLKNENAFKNWSSKLIRMARTAVLFHDVGRFQETVDKLKYPNVYSDHALLGYDFLRQYPEYNDLRILLPVKYHSCMIEELYKDHKYQNVEDPQIKYEIEKITFLVRDADKIANFNLLAHSDKDIRRLFNIELKSKTARTPLSPAVQACVFEKRPVKREDVRTLSDSILSLICWIFDLNYNSSFSYIRKNECFDFLLQLLNKSNADAQSQKKIETAVNDYLNNKYQQLQGTL